MRLFALVGAASALQLRPRGGATKVTPTVTGGVVRALGWTAAETALLVSAFAWAAGEGDPNIELAVAFVLIFGASAIADVLLSITSATVSAPVRQILVPNQTPDQTWYDKLPKPKWNPPTWVFPIMWLLVAKPTQLVALGRLHSGDFTGKARAVYCLHLALGDTWNRVFFGEKMVGLGVIVIYAFAAALATAAVLFAMVDIAAGLLLLPTLIWVLVASSLNFRIWQLLSEKRR